MNPYAWVVSIRIDVRKRIDCIVDAMVEADRCVR